MAQAISQGVASLDSTLARACAALVDGLTTQINVLNESLQGTLAGLDQRIDATTEAFTGILTERLREVEQTIETRTVTLANALAARSQELGAALAAGTQTTNDNLEQALTAIDGLFAERTSALVHTLDTRSSRSAPRWRRVRSRECRAGTDPLRSRRLLLRTDHRPWRPAGSRAEQFGETISERVQSVGDMLLARADHVGETLGARTDASAPSSRSARTMCVTALTAAPRKSPASLKLRWAGSSIW